jgi:oligoendopeptidase F
VDAGLDDLYYALADSPLRQELESDEYFGPDFLDDYEGDSIWDETFTSLMEQETELINRYYTLSEEMLDAHASEDYKAIQGEMETLFVSLVENRQTQAAHLEYDSYMDFAYDYYYSRDYTPSQVVPYLTRIREELVPLYRRIDRRAYREDYCREEDMFRYVKSTAYAMGGTVAEAFELMEDAGLYDISHSETKYNSSFEIYLPVYYVPFVFVNPPADQSAKLTFAHEFGHFANDYACYGSSASVDVAEFFSQGYEYLSLLYADDTKTLTQMKMMDCLCIFVEQSAYAAFEHQVYGLSPDTLSEESIRDLFQQICEDYGFDEWGIDGNDYVTVPHFFTNPLYVISYVVSNDAAFQLYQLEQGEPGAGLELYEEQLSSSETAFLSFTESAGLTSPFEEDRIQSIRKTLEDIL